MNPLVAAKIKSSCALAPRPLSDVSRGVGIPSGDVELFATSDFQRGGVVLFEFGGEKWLGLERLGLKSSSSVTGIYRVNETGSIVHDGSVTRLSVDWFYARGEAIGCDLRAGLHPAFRVGVPVRGSWLGRPLVFSYENHVPRAVGGSDWAPAEMFEYLASSSWDAPGCFILGEVNMERASRAIANTTRLLVSRTARAALYQKMATEGAAVGVLRERFGSNPVWGRFRKFTCVLESTGAVVVKYAPSDSEDAGKLMANYIALQVLKEYEPSLAVDSEIIESGGFLFLQTSRVDRRGGCGRVGIQSARDLDDDLKSGGNWEEFAATACAQGVISNQDRDRLGMLALFADKIGNVYRNIDDLLFFLPSLSCPDQSPLAPVFNLGATGLRERSSGSLTRLAFDPSGALSARAEMLADEFWRRRK